MTFHNVRSVFQRHGIRVLTPGQIHADAEILVPKGIQHNEEVHSPTSRTRWPGN
jgi:hypothetical protein